MNAPPLPLGWSEHIGPGGQIYYYNAQTGESTYVRPIPTFPAVPIAPPDLSKKKKEKPLVKTPVPGTDWMRVKTTEGNIFYSHKIKKESVWIIPEEIKGAVEALEENEREMDIKARRASVLQAADVIQDGEYERRQEIDRVKNEVQGIVKRKAEDMVPINELVTAKKSKKSRIEEDEAAPQADETEESEEEEWQKEAAAQLAVEAEMEKRREEEEAERKKKEAESEIKQLRSAQLSMPERVDLSLDEAKALFKTLLREKDINPLHPWDTSLPQFISDPRYVLLPSVSVRREAFDEYCRDRARELRQSAVNREKDAVNPREEFDRLLKDQVQSTRSTWSEFRRAWKKDRRFYGWGRDDREREKRFREYIKELGEKKRAVAQKAEFDFFALLREQKFVEGAAWKDVKRELYTDPRYDAVGSSSLREDLYNTFLKGSQPPLLAHTSLNKGNNAEWNNDEEPKQKNRKQKMEQAVKEREGKVKAELERMEFNIERSRREIHMEEGEKDFKGLLTDAVRDPQMSWDTALPQLRTDSRFRNSPLPLNQQLHLFHAHVEHLRSKHLSSLYSIFEAHASTLATNFDNLQLSSLLSSIPVTKLGLNVEALRHEFEKWQRERTHGFRKAFDEMLAENSFVEFWGRLSKIGGEGIDGGVKADELEGDEGEGGGGRVDMKVLAKNVDVREVEKVLKNDKRYIMFDHIPSQREQWIRDYLSNLSAPRLSVHTSS